MTIILNVLLNPLIELAHTPNKNVHTHTTNEHVHTLNHKWTCTLPMNVHVHHINV